MGHQRRQALICKAVVDSDVRSAWDKVQRNSRRTGVWFAWCTRTRLHTQGRILQDHENLLWGSPRWARERFGIPPQTHYNDCRSDALVPRVLQVLKQTFDTKLQVGDLLRWKRLQIFNGWYCSKQTFSTWARVGTAHQQRGITQLYS